MSSGGIFGEPGMCCAPETIIPTGKSWEVTTTSPIGKEDFGNFLLKRRKRRHQSCWSKSTENLNVGDRRRRVGQLVRSGLPRSDARWYFRVMAVMVEKISAITFRTANMKASLRFHAMFWLSIIGSQAHDR